MAKSRHVASRASVSIADGESGISAVCSLPRYRIVIENLPTGAPQASGCDTSFCSPTCAILTWRLEPLGEIIRRKLMPNLEHVPWREILQSQQVSISNLVRNARKLIK